MHTATIVVPCYNEARRLDAAAFVKFVADDPPWRFLFVNDGSTDGTLDLLHDLAEYRPDFFSVLSLSQNVGKAEAVRQGMQRAFASPARHVGYWDADLATPLDAIPAFCEALDRRPETEIVCGVRLPLLGRRIERQRLRGWLGRCFARAASWTLGVRVVDTQCGAKLFRNRRDLAALFAEPFQSRWIFDVELLARLTAQHGGPRTADLARRVYELPLDEWREVRGSKVRPRDFLKAARELWRIRGFLSLNAADPPPLPANVAAPACPEEMASLSRRALAGKASDGR